ncbi:glycosyl transferase family 1 [Mesorhizobium sp. BAC0120]|uniref:glycosyl transferase family 1 n=1 Tax=Mesorhizobium sp. BAC0120 TaxID=3090670 RepID=UPI00298D16E6|nr:glycosyl transferase family 1 [Mesorhizobium sp. BAC0120]MDW6022609.1 glycosyl transferase family 1 [Mesorhizobium sp. BAC0120]
MSPKLHVLYFVHDLSDPAVRRRVIMLQAGGAQVTLAGFRRAATVVPGLEAMSPIDLGRTADGKFAQRLVAVAKAALSLGAKLRTVRRPDVIIGRNLEMLALAKRARALFSANIPIVYECLDIHRLLLGQNGISRAMRGAERVLGRNAVLLMTSSPAFVRDYFQRFRQIDAPVALLHNKVLELAGEPSDVRRQVRAPQGGEPWTIGWFGALRCRKSLELLAAFTHRMEGRFDVVLRGRPAYSEFPDFDGFVAGQPHMRFEGGYRNPEDLADIYGEVHFSWAIDFFEEGLNSNWLLPNRLYEGCRHGTVPIAMRGTETGRFLAERHLGLLLDEASVASVMKLFDSFDAERYAALRGRVLAEDRGTWVCDARDCRALVERLRELTAAPEPVMQAA